MNPQPLNLPDVVARLEKELATRQSQFGFPITRSKLRIDPSLDAIVLADQVPDEASDFALALKATAQQRHDDARHFLRTAQENKEVEQARLLIASAANEFYDFQYQEAVTNAQKAVALHPDNDVYQRCLGYYLWYVGRFTEAEVPISAALKLREAGLGTHHPDIAEDLSKLAMLCIKQGKMDEAEALYLRALAIREAKLGPNDYITAGSLSDIAEFYRMQGRLDEGEPLFRRAIAIWEETGPTRVAIPDKLYEEGTLRIYQNRLPEAELLFRQACDIWEQVFGLTHPCTFQTLQMIGDVLNAQNKFDEAEVFYRRSQEAESEYRRTHSKILVSDYDA